MSNRIAELQQLIKSKAQSSAEVLQRIASNQEVETGSFTPTGSDIRRKEWLNKDIRESDE